MKVYVFGNEDLSTDNAAIKFAGKMRDKLKGVEFIRINVNEDLPFDNKEDVVILDTVMGIKQVTLINDEDLSKLVLSKSISAHDYDLAFQIKYLRKLGKLGKVTIVGIPMNSKVDYFLIKSNLRKLVAQDIQGS